MTFVGLVTIPDKPEQIRLKAGFFPKIRARRISIPNEGCFFIFRPTDSRTRDFFIESPHGLVPARDDDFHVNAQQRSMILAQNGMGTALFRIHSITPRSLFYSSAIGFMMRERKKTAEAVFSGDYSESKSATWAFKASKVSSLMSCSIRQASSVAIFSSTPRRSKNEVSNLCRS